MRIIVDLIFQAANISDMEIGKKRVLITGCSSGFGLLTAVSAAKAGFDVVATMRNLNKAKDLRDALEAAKLKAEIAQLDVTKPDTIKTTVDKYGPFDILVNNAGILIGGSFIDTTIPEMRKVLDTDYFGAIELTRAVVPDMIKKRQGLIINVASLAGRVGHMFNATYSAAKHAIIGFSKSTRLELRPFNIRVVSVEPGYFKTEIIGKNAYLSENFYNRNSPMFELNRGFLRLMMKEIIPRAGDPQIVADKIVKIMRTARPKNHYIIGKDAWLAVICQWLGLSSLLEKIAYNKLLRNTQKEIKRKQKKPKN
jgi:NAD(P)-dependent dehydrogenase (short-subunit alcohol dehydrogenase family)